MELTRVHRDVKGATRYLEAAVARITAMSVRHGGDAEWLSQHVWNLFAQRSNLLGLWVRTDKNDDVIGHVVATIQQWNGENVAWIHQAENDGPPLDRAFWNRGLAELHTWVASVNASLQPGTQSVRRLLFSTPHDPKVFDRCAGFRVYRTLMEREV